jgi:hypothetical protein
LATLEDKNYLSLLGINEVAQAVSMLSTIRDNGSGKDQVLAACVLIQKEYPKLTINELKQVIIDGIMQKYNDTDRPQYNDIPTLMFWLKQYKSSKSQKTGLELYPEIKP